MVIEDVALVCRIAAERYPQRSLRLKVGARRQPDGPNQRGLQGNVASAESFGGSAGWDVGLKAEGDLHKLAIEEQGFGADDHIGETGRVEIALDAAVGDVDGDAGPARSGFGVEPHFADIDA